MGLERGVSPHIPIIFSSNVNDVIRQFEQREIKKHLSGFDIFHLKAEKLLIEGSDYQFIERVGYKISRNDYLNLICGEISDLSKS